MSHYFQGAVFLCLFLIGLAAPTLALHQHLKQHLLSNDGRTADQPPLSFTSHYTSHQVVLFVCSHSLFPSRWNLFHFHPPLDIYLHFSIHMFFFPPFLKSRPSTHSSPPAFLLSKKMKPCLARSPLSCSQLLPHLPRHPETWEGRNKGPLTSSGEVIKQKSNCINAH